MTNDIKYSIIIAKDENIIKGSALSQHKKTIEKLRQRPINKNIRFAEVENLLLRLGFKETLRGSSHAIFRHPNLRDHVTIKKQEYIAIYLVEDIIKILDELEVEEDV